MEAFQPVLIALLALNLAIFLPLIVRRARERRERRREQAIIDAATPRMRLRLAAIADASIVLEEPVPLRSPRPTIPETTTDLEPVAVATATAAAVPTAGTPPPAAGTPVWARRRAWRDASAALFAFVCIGLLVVVAAPGLGAFAPVAEATPAPTPLSTRIAVTLPTDPPSPPPSLPLTAIARPIASFTCSHRPGRRVAFDDTSETWGKPATYDWDFGGDGSSSAVNPKHKFSARRGYTVTLVVSNSAGPSAAFAVHVHVDGNSGC